MPLPAWIPRWRSRTTSRSALCPVSKVPGARGRGPVDPAQPVGRRVVADRRHVGRDVDRLPAVRLGDAVAAPLGHHLQECMECGIDDDLVLRGHSDPLWKQTERVAEACLERSEVMDAPQVECAPGRPRDAAARRQREGAAGRVAGELGAVAYLAIRQAQAAHVLDREGLLERLAHHERALRRLTGDPQLPRQETRPDVRDCEQQDEDIRQRVRKTDAGDPGEERQDRDTRDQRYPRSHDAPTVRTAITVTPGAGPSSALTRLPGSPRGLRRR
jgi:hypothetical protein